MDIKLKLGTRKAKCHAKLGDQNNMDATISDMTDLLNNVNIEDSGIIVD